MGKGLFVFLVLMGLAQSSDAFAPSCGRIFNLPAAQTLLAGEHTLVTWNIAKGLSDGFLSELDRVTDGVDFVLLQEATDSSLSRFHVVDEFDFREYNHTWRWAGFSSGLLTLSRVIPEVRQFFRSKKKEPFGLPKAIQVMTYATGQPEQDFLVVNIHALNFVGIKAFASHIRQLTEVLSNHHGPMIVAGDWNTWNQERMTFLAQTLGELQIQQVEPRYQSRPGFVGRLDHIFTRGVEIIEAVELLTSTSDHNPLLLKFILR